MISKVARSFEGYKEACKLSISGYGLVEVHVHMYKLLSLLS